MMKLAKAHLAIAALFCMAVAGSSAITGCSAGKSAGGNPAPPPSSPDQPDNRTNEEATVGAVRPDELVQITPPTVLPVANSPLAASISVKVLDSAVSFKCGPPNAGLNLRSLPIYELIRFDQSRTERRSTRAEYLARALDRLKTYSPMRAARVQASIEQIQNQPSIVMPAQIEVSGLYWVPEGCVLDHTILIARQNEQSQYFVDQTKLNALAPEDQAALILQIALDDEALLNKSEDLVGARRMARWLLDFKETSWTQYFAAGLRLGPKTIFDYTYANGDVAFLNRERAQRHMRNESFRPEFEILACGYSLVNGKKDLSLCESDSKAELSIYSENAKRILRIVSAERATDEKLVYLVPAYDLGFPSNVTDYYFRAWDGEPKGIRVKFSTEIPYLKGNVQSTCKANAWANYIYAELPPGIFKIPRFEDFALHSCVMKDDNFRFTVAAETYSAKGSFSYDKSGRSSEADFWIRDGFTQDIKIGPYVLPKEQIHSISADPNSYGNYIGLISEMDIKVKGSSCVITTDSLDQVKGRLVFSGRTKADCSVADGRLSVGEYNTIDVDALTGLPRNVGAHYGAASRLKLGGQSISVRDIDFDDDGVPSRFEVGKYNIGGYYYPHNTTESFSYFDSAGEKTNWPPKKDGSYEITLTYNAKLKRVEGPVCEECKASKGKAK